MAKKKKGGKSSLLPMLAIGIGIYLLTRPPKVVKTDNPPIIPPLPLPLQLPTGAPAVQRLRPRKHMPHYI